MTPPAKLGLELPERPVEVKRAILEQEREAWYNTVYQSRVRMEAQELIQATFKREGGDALIVQLTQAIEDAIIAIAFYDKQLTALPPKKDGAIEPTKAA
jgi:hypothetical protein